MRVLADLQNAVMSISEAGFEVAVEEVRTLGGEYPPPIRSHTTHIQPTQRQRQRTRYHVFSH